MTATIKKVVSHTSIYFFGNIARNAVSIIMLPIYTRYLTPDDYGVVELLSMLIDFVGIILAMRMGESVFRFYCVEENIKEKNSVISTSLITGVLLNAVGVIFIIIFSENLSIILFGTNEYAFYVTLFSFTLLFVAIIEIAMIYMRASQRPWHFVIFSVIKLVIQLCLNIYLVVVKEMHVEGVVYSALISSAVMAVILVVYTVYYVRIRFSYRISKQILTFSFPVILAGIGAFYLGFGDRYFLRLYWGLSEVGIYSLGYKFGFILMIITWNPFQNIWDSLRYDIYKRSDARALYQRLFMFVSFAMVSTALLISLFVKDLLMIMSDQSFWSAYTVVPIVLLAYIFQAWTAYCYFGFLLKKKTMHIAVGTAVAVVVITIAYLVLIPVYGAMGAAWATLVGFLVRLIWTEWWSRKYYDMELQWGRAALLVTFSTITYLLSLLSPEQLILSLSYRAGLFILFIMMCMKSPMLAETDKKKIINIFKNPLKIKRSLSGL